MSSGHHGRIDQSAEYSELVRILTSEAPGGALVIGGSGTGKTSLVQAALARPDVVAPVMALYCSPTLADVAYGALSPYLSALERTDDTVRVLREIQALIAEAGTTTTLPIVVVEDAQFLDAESAFALSMLVENAVIKLVAIGAGRVEGETTLFSLTERGLLATIVVQPLDVAGVRSLAQDLTGGQLAEGTVEIIHAMTGGNPSFVAAFVRSSLAQGILVQDSGEIKSGDDGEIRWMIARIAPEPDEGLIELVREMHFLLPPGQQRTLEVLALGGPQHRAVLFGCDGGEYRHLLEAGVLTTDRDEEIHLLAEIHAMALRHNIAPGRSAELYNRWNEHREELNRSLTPSEVLWSLENSADIPDEVALEAVERANIEMDYQLAWKICAVSGIAAETDEGTLAEAWTLFGLGRHYSVRAMLARLSERTEDPMVLQEALNLLARTLTNMGAGTVELGALDGVWRERARTAKDRAAFASTRDQHQRTTELLDLWSRANTSEVGAHLFREVHAVLDETDLTTEAHTLGLLLLSDLYSVEGRTETALALDRKAMTATDQSEQLASRYRLHVLFRMGWNLLFSGRYAEAEELLAVRRGKSVRRVLHEQGTIALLRGIGQMLSGQTLWAGQTLSDAISELKLRDPLQVLQLARAVTAFNSGSANSPPSINEEREATSSLALTPAPGGDQDGAAGNNEPYQRLLARAVSAGLPGVESEGLEAYPLIEREGLALSPERLQLGTSRAVHLTGRLFDLAAEMEGPRAGFLTRLAAPVMGKDPVALKDLADRAVEERELRIAAECLARAAVLWSEAGDTRRCGALLRELMYLVRENHMTPVPFVARAMAMAELTNREEEIVDLARGGKNNAQIARTLTVSQRTVEGHLYRVFSKLGISDRSELLGLSLPMGTKQP